MMFYQRPGRHGGLAKGKKEMINEIYLARLVDGAFIELPDIDWEKVCRQCQDFEVFLVPERGGSRVMLTREEATKITRDLLEPGRQKSDSKGITWWYFDFDAGSCWIDDISYTYRVTRSK